ncbi:hypothetical protein HYQ46_008227 [Verticillium longisporum]|nr:hypothetical protein HYQ44_011983 [Verticillium longisporum]KAG7139212.1 hypothetical protein HYQ46_008227 [Verticillium longisporum]
MLQNLSNMQVQGYMNKADTHKSLPIDPSLVLSIRPGLHSTHAHSPSPDHSRWFRAQAPTPASISAWLAELAQGFELVPWC